MAKLNVKQIMEREAKAQTRKDEWRSIYEDCYEFALPQRNLYSGFYEGGVAGQNKMLRVFDSTAIHATQRFANRIQAGLFPPYKKWCRLEAGSSIPPDKKEQATQVLDAYTERMFETLRQTNFDLAIGEFLLDLCVGTAVMMIMPGDEVTPIRFTPVPQYLVAFEEGPFGTVDNVYRKLRMKGEAIKQEYPDANIPAHIQQEIDNSPDKDIDLIDAVIFDKDMGVFNYHVIWPGKNHELVQRTMKSNPFVVARYMKVAGEVYGRGPLVTAIADIKTLNKTLELVLKNASIAVAGVYTAADDGILNPNNVQIKPGSVIAVARNGGPQGPSLMPLPRSSDFNLSQIIINDLRMNIKKILMDDTLPPDNMSARSATEISERTRELATNLGSAFGRLINETMIPVVTRILFVMDQMALIDMPLRVNGLEVKVTPVSPLSQAQKLQEVQDAMQYTQIAMGMGPTGAATVSVVRLLQFVAERMGIDSRVIATQEEQMAFFKQMQQQQMAEQQAAMAQQAPQEAMQ
jgi:hypothetical protein